ncbi:SRPBCC family protein [Agromyces sp. NPDC049794]|uniref:SRPBCC family protein n=1 Tax=unclassified Agromyces TaxID=2639701 RepID=UPI0033F23C98
MELEVSTTIRRPVAAVWDFCAVHHVENHPRWDPDIQLEDPQEGPIGVGSVIRRRSIRFEPPTEGTMEITEFEPGRAMRTTTHDGAMTIHGWLLLAARGPEATQLTLGAEFPEVDASMADRIKPLMERSAANIKALIEHET